MSIVRVRLSAPLQPRSRDEVRALEAVLYTASILKPEAIELISRAEDKTSVISELHSIASILSRFKANYSYGLISEELGIPDKTVRRILKGESEASRIVLGVLSELEAKGGAIDVSLASIDILEKKLGELEAENKELRGRVSELEAEVSRLNKLLDSVRERIKEISGILQG